MRSRIELGVLLAVGICVVLLLELDGKPVRLVDPTGKVKTDLNLEVWR